MREFSDTSGINLTFEFNFFIEILTSGFNSMQNYPNPFNPVTYIKFDVANVSKVKLHVYDVTGKEVASIVNEELLPGRYEYKWDASQFSRGIYFYRLSANGLDLMTKSMLLVK